MVFFQNIGLFIQILINAMIGQKDQNHLLTQKQKGFSTIVAPQPLWFFFLGFSGERLDGALWHLTYRPAEKFGSFGILFIV